MLKKVNNSQTDYRANLNHGKPLNFGNESKLSPALGRLQLAATLTNAGGINCHQTGNGTERAGGRVVKEERGLCKAYTGKKGHSGVGERPYENF